MPSKIHFGSHKKVYTMSNKYEVITYEDAIVFNYTLPGEESVE